MLYYFVSREAKSVRPFAATALFGAAISGTADMRQQMRFLSTDTRSLESTYLN